MSWGVKGERVEPDPVASSAELVLFGTAEEASRGRIFTSPFLTRIDGRPFVGHTPDFDDLF